MLLMQLYMYRQGMMKFVLQDGWSPLHIASLEGHLDIAKTLIEAGANVNQVDKVQYLNRLHVVLCVIVICEHTYIACVLIHAAYKAMSKQTDQYMHVYVNPQPFVINCKISLQKHIKQKHSVD